jgi:hypothetical protein
MIIPMKYTHFGYKFNDSVPGRRRHSGVDLNYGAPYDDKGMPVKAMAAGS